MLSFPKDNFGFTDQNATKEDVYKKLQQKVREFADPNSHKDMKNEDKVVILAAQKTTKFFGHNSDVSTELVHKKFNDYLMHYFDKLHSENGARAFGHRARAGDDPRDDGDKRLTLDERIIKNRQYLESQAKASLDIIGIEKEIEELKKRHQPMQDILQSLTNLRQQHENLTSVIPKNAYYSDKPTVPGSEADSALNHKIDRPGVAGGPAPADPLDLDFYPGGPKRRAVHDVIHATDKEYEAKKDALLHSMPDDKSKDEVKQFIVDMRLLSQAKLGDLGRKIGTGSYDLQTLDGLLGRFQEVVRDNNLTMASKVENLAEAKKTAQLTPAPITPPGTPATEEKDVLEEQEDDNQVNGSGSGASGNGGGTAGAGTTTTVTPPKDSWIARNPNYTAFALAAVTLSTLGGPLFMYLYERNQQKKQAEQFATALAQLQSGGSGGYGMNGPGGPGGGPPPIAAGGPPGQYPGS